ncbi:hypothetical protein DRJ22_02255 [Candidatus Woesearchaeota archaeon]|nr:MAG: hypothetical protein B6U93_01060 [Candidatus Woesearchaeota archaeon ex4484_78]RLE46326.1 MAG: hypothetical protein DRJ22_02255 [Candidatus Woesearchaeota archaeon]
MKFVIKEKKHPNIPKYAGSDYELARQFSKKLHEELGDFVQAIVLFGSAARDERPLYGERDIDVLVIINDLTKILNPEVIQAYRVITERTASKISKRFHIITLKITSFWDYLRNGDPIAINILRDGVPMFDIGFFEPAQQLLFDGKIRPSREAIWTYFARAPATLNNADWHLLQAAVDLYWAVVDSAHAALMKLGEVPPTPGHVADIINKVLVRKKLVPAKYAKIMRDFYDLSKKIMHRQVQKITGKEYDRLRFLAKDFVAKMQKIVEKL